MENAPGVALFIDYENVVYGSVNYGREVPSPSDLMDIAKKRGRVVIARAFADFNEPTIAQFGDSLSTASIETIHCASEQRRDGVAKRFTDFQLLDNIYQTTYTNPHISDYVLVTGDGHFSPVVSFLRHRLQKTVTVVGWRDQIHPRLQQSASEVEYLEIRSQRTLEPDQITDLIRFVYSGEAAGKVITFSSIARYFRVPGITETAMHNELRHLRIEGVFIQVEEDLNGRRIKRVYLNREHSLVKRALGLDMN